MDNQQSKNLVKSKKLPLRFCVISALLLAAFIVIRTFKGSVKGFKKHKYISVLLLTCTFFSVTANAAVPIDNYMEIKDGRHIITKTFEAAPDEDPSLLIEENFEQDGFSYAYFETAKEEVPAVEKRQEVQTATVTTADDDIQSILQKFAPEMEYTGEDGFTGRLLIDHATVTTEAEGYVTKTFTVTDTATVMGLSSNDPSVIPKSTVKSGVTLTLQSIDWSAQASQAIDYDTVTTMYQAVARYSGSYTKQVPTGYISTAEYKGEVTKTQVEKVIYTLTYLGSELPKPTSIPTPEPEPETSQNKSSFILSALGVLAVIALVTSAVLFFIFYYNTFVYLKSGDEYNLISRKRIKWSNPVVDLNGLDVGGKEVAVNVKKTAAEKLFGRHIKTVADGNVSIKCLVDKQHSDFWYVVKIPAEKVEIPEVISEESDQK